MDAHHSLTVLIERDEDGSYIAVVPELSGCFTRASDPSGAAKNIREQVKLSLSERTRGLQSGKYFSIRWIAGPRLRREVAHFLDEFVRLN